MKKENSLRRGTWFGVNPVTKIIPDKKKEAAKKKCRNRHYTDDEDN